MKKKLLQCAGLMIPKYYVIINTTDKSKCILFEMLNTNKNCNFLACDLILNVYCSRESDITRYTQLKHESPILEWFNSISIFGLANIGM